MCFNQLRKAHLSNMIKINVSKRQITLTDAGFKKKCNDSSVPMINTDLEPPSDSQYIDLIVFLMVWRF